jgi:hypothetical protein
MTDPNEEFRFIEDALRLLGNDVQSDLASRGWAVADLGVPDGDPLEWFWPPTAPVGYGGLSDWSDEAMQHRPQMHGPRHTPWRVPTRITKAQGGWRVEYGEAIAQEPDAVAEYADDASLLADLERIECWPMNLDEARLIRRERLFAVTTALAQDAHYQGFTVTEPYSSRINAIRPHLMFERSRAVGLAATAPPSTPRPRGDLAAHMNLIDAEAWASAVRTARAGGEGWGVSGPERPRV